MSCVLGGIVPLGLALLVCGTQGFLLPNVTQLEKLLGRYQQAEPHSRARRAIPREDREEILRLHNKLRGQVSPSASNMEYMVSTTACCPSSVPSARAGPGAPHANMASSPVPSGHLGRLARVGPATF